MKSEVRLIDANAATLSTYNNPYWTESEAAGVRSFLLHQPTIDPETIRPTGRWVMTIYTTTSERGRVISNQKFSCSECGYGNGRKQSNFCPNCVAKMEG